MNEYLNCNIDKCNAILNGRVWVTCCLHVFCTEHGASYFHNNKIQVNCPVCNEVNVRENDTVLSNTNPHDMILAGLRPEKIIRLVERSFKLWKCQLDAERRHEASKILILSKQLEENTNHFKQTLHRREMEYSGQIAGLQANYNDAMIKLNQVSQELEMAKASLRKYKGLHESWAHSRVPRVARPSPSYGQPSFAMPEYPGVVPQDDMGSAGISNPTFHDFSQI